jgi:hypothetical protein
VVVYRINLQSKPDEYEAIPLPADKLKAVQPFSVRQDSPNQQLGSRLLAFLRKHRKNFEDADFVWKGESEPIKSAEIVLPEWLRQK